MHKHIHALRKSNETLMSFYKLPTALHFSVNLFSCLMLLAPLRAVRKKNNQAQNKGSFCCISGIKGNRNEWKFS